MPLTYEDIAGKIDHSLLGPTLTDSDLAIGCRLAAEYRVASVCIKPYAVAMAAEVLKGSGVAVGTTIGFPHGGHTTGMKLLESEQAMSDGATELDMVVNIGRVIGGDWGAVEAEVGAITKLAHDRGAIVKVIFENCYLDDSQKVRLSEICGAVGADFIKTSTGYGTGGATLHDLRLMRKSTAPCTQLKAAGGVRTLEAIAEVIGVGCTRIGLSKTKELLDEFRARLERGETLEVPAEAAESKLGGGY
ncbi:MAG: deoxyribose-phosphate aldolase [Isosphaeraceae bacterium]